MRDYKLNNSGDLDIVGGDLATGDALRDNQYLLLTTEKGGLRDHPLSTLGLLSYLNDERPEALIREVRRVMTLDGQRVRSVRYDGRKLNIDATYG
jgi:hypothetical protein